VRGSRARTPAAPVDTADARLTCPLSRPDPDFRSELNDGALLLLAADHRGHLRVRPKRLTKRVAERPRGGAFAHVGGALDLQHTPTLAEQQLQMLMGAKRRPPVAEEHTQELVVERVQLGLMDDIPMHRRRRPAGATHRRANSDPATCSELSQAAAFLASLEPRMHGLPPEP
jgi:hypothetical protein